MYERSQETASRTVDPGVLQCNATTNKQTSPFPVILDSVDIPLQPKAWL